MRTVGKVRVPVPDGEATPESFNPGCFRKAILHRAEEMAAILEDLKAVLERLGYSAWDILGVRLAVEEAINNGLRHGNRGDPAKRLRLRWSVGPKVMLAEVEDEGLGFDPALVPDPSRYETRVRTRGCGLLLMHLVMNRVEFSARGTRVRMCKRRSR
jgi:serine/threonine-protein kinase RsbW